MKDETYKRLRHEPESWTVEVHTVEVYVGTGGDHQDEFLRGKRPKDLLRGSIVTPSLHASILNVKYVNSSALHRVEQEFQRNGVNISRQTMSNWIIRCAEKYFAPFMDRMKQELLSLPATQSDETPTQVIGDSDRPNKFRGIPGITKDRRILPDRYRTERTSGNKSPYTAADKDKAAG